MFLLAPPSLGSMAYWIWGVMFGNGHPPDLAVNASRGVPPGGMVPTNNLKVMLRPSRRRRWLSTLVYVAFAINNWCPRPESNRHAPCGKRQILNLLCLPISPLGQTQSIIVIKNVGMVMHCNKLGCNSSYHEDFVDCPQGVE